MEFSASGADAIPWILVSIIVPIIIFTLIPVLIIRSVMKGLKRNLPAGISVSQITKIARQFPKGANWQKIMKEWDFKTDPVTKRLIVKRKTDAPTMPGNMSSEFRIDSLSQLPGILQQLDSGQATTITQSGKIESNEPASPPPVSAPSRISESSVKTGPIGPSQSPRSYEIIQTIKRVAIILLLIGLFYGIKDFLA